MEHRPGTTTDHRQYRAAASRCLRWLVLGLALALLVGLLVQPAVATTSDAGHGGDHGSEAHGASGIHLAVEGLQIVAGLGALGAVVLAGQKFRGGHIEQPLYLAGGGVAVFALQRLWHNAHEFGLVASPGSLSTQALFLIALGLLAAGFFMLWDSMRRPA